jgi:RNA polymerase sigma-70 factor (ECF subfamily)
MKNNDRQLVRRCLDGERAAFDALYDRHAARVFHLLRRMTQNEAEAEDLAQETFLTAYRRLSAWRGDAAFGTWLCGIAVRLYADARRRAPRETEPLDEESFSAAPDADPLAHCLRHEKQQRIEDAIATLPPLSREVFLLVTVEGLSYREAAAWLDVPIGTIKSRLWRAVCGLQSRLIDLGRPAGEEAPVPTRVRRQEPPCPAACSPDRPLGGS